jgi:two-component system sensor histidine kinase YesM
MLLFFIVSLISKSIKDWIVKTNRLCSEINDILLDNVICFEITQLNTGIINLVTRVQKLTEEKIFEENKNREIEINFLHEQIKPHFLYNTLSTIEQLGGLGNYETMIEVIKSLSGFYKLGLSKGKEIVNLNNEINHASCYLNIQKVINNNISYMIDVPEYCTKLMLIKFTLQPLVENAVLHAVKHGEMLTITISASIANNDLVIFILDNGIGIKKDELFKLKTALAANNWSELSNVYGMRNVNERIRLHYGQRYGLDIESTYDVGTKISITIPVQEGK